MKRKVLQENRRRTKIKSRTKPALSGHRDRFNQLLDDAVTGVKKK